MTKDQQNSVLMRIPTDVEKLRRMNVAPARCVGMRNSDYG
jgi:hypothetical protein